MKLYCPRPASQRVYIYKIITDWINILGKIIVGFHDSNRTTKLFKNMRYMHRIDDRNYYVIKKPIGKLYKIVSKW